VKSVFVTLHANCYHHNFLALPGKNASVKSLKLFSLKNDLRTEDNS